MDEPDQNKSHSRRNFLAAIAAALAAAGFGAASYAFTKALGFSRDILMTGRMKVDISKLKPGDFKSVLWRKQPIFILRRTPEMIKITSETNPSSLEDPAAPKDRYIEPDLFVSIGICTHLGCIPLFRSNNLPGLKQPGFYCPCHGGEYDTLGRRLSGPPPENLHLVPYRILGKGELEIGTETFPGFSADIRKIEKLPKIKL